MNKLFKVFYIGFLMLFYIDFVLANGGNVCGFTYTHTGALHQSPSEQSVFYVQSGNVIIRGKNYIFNGVNNPSTKVSSVNEGSNMLTWYYDTDSVQFGVREAKFNKIHERGAIGNYPAEGYLFHTEDMSIPRSNRVLIAKNGDIYANGNILYDEKGRGSDEAANVGTCRSDGWYCGNTQADRTGSLARTDEPVSGSSWNFHYKSTEDRNYYCDIESIFSGTCKFDVEDAQTCDSFPPTTYCNGPGDGGDVWIKYPGCRDKGRNTPGCDEYHYKYSECGNNQCGCGHWEDVYCTPPCPPCSCPPCSEGQPCPPCSCPPCPGPYVCGQRYVCDGYIHRGCAGPPGAASCYVYSDC